MAQNYKVSDVLQAVANSQIRIALERLMKIAGVALNDRVDDDLEKNVTGTITGNVTGDLTGTASNASKVDGLKTDTDDAVVAATDGAVVVPITNTYSSYTTNATGAIAATLADGVVGQDKIIKLDTLDTNNMVLTPANFNNGTTITFDATGEIAILKFIGTGWEVIYTNATVA